MVKPMTVVALLGILAASAGLTQRCSAEPKAQASDLFQGSPATSWHTMAPIEKGWVAGMLISASAGPYGNPDNVQLLEIKAARTPAGDLVVACGRMRNGEAQGVFSATYDPATITRTGQAVYRLQNNIMTGKRSVETTAMSVSKTDEALIMADCAYAGLL